MKLRFDSARAKAKALELAHRAEIDRAVVFGILNTAWRFIGGPAVALAIAFRFNPEVQGYYYTFRSLLGLQVFVDLGLSHVIVQFTSHEWAYLRLDSQGEIVGDSNALSRLISLGRFATIWYIIAAIATTLGLTSSGYYFFSRSPQAHGIQWHAPWTALCIVAALHLLIGPVWYILEGCNQVSEVYRYRLTEALLTSAVLVTAILFGAGLWAPVIATGADLVWAGRFFSIKYRRFLTCFLTQPAGPRIEWRREIFTLQWRVAISWLSGYLADALFIPVLFRYQGSSVAGQMGMTLQLFGLVTQTSSWWAVSKAPRFGVLIEQRRYDELDRLLIKIVVVSSLVGVSGVLAAWSMVYFLSLFRYWLAARLLPPLPTALFLGAALLWQATQPLAVYLRAHKKEPLLWLSVVSGVATGFMTWYTGSRFDVVAIAAVYLVWHGVAVPIATFAIWQRCREMWHSNTQNEWRTGEALVS